MEIYTSELNKRQLDNTFMKKRIELFEKYKKNVKKDEDGTILLSDVIEGFEECYIIITPNNKIKKILSCKIHEDNLTTKLMKSNNVNEIKLYVKNNSMFDITPTICYKISI